MPIMILVRRFLLFSLALGVPFAIIGLSLGWLKGLAISELLLVVALVAVWITAEKGLLKAYHVQQEIPAGASRSLERVVALLGGQSPFIRAFSDPAPQALVMRGFFSPGVIVLSEGLLGILTEDELRELLRTSVQRIRAPGMPFQTLCAWLAHLTLALAPRAWMELLFGELKWHERLGALNALCFLPIFSTAKFFVSLARMPEDKSGYSVNAPRAFSRLAQLTSEVTNPGSCTLHLVDPWNQRSLFPL